MFRWDGAGSSVVMLICVMTMDGCSLEWREVWLFSRTTGLENLDPSSSVQGHSLCGQVALSELHRIGQDSSLWLSLLIFLFVNSDVF